MGLILEPRHLQDLAAAFFDNLTMVKAEYGGVGLDPKRPFGNSDVEADILGIIKYGPEGSDGEYTDGQRKYAAALYRNLIPYLQRNYGPKKEPKA